MPDAGSNTKLDAVKYLLVRRLEAPIEEDATRSTDLGKIFIQPVTFKDRVFLTNSEGEKVDLMETIAKLQAQIESSSNKRQRKADLAEWLEHQSRDEEILPGDVVYCQGGKITKRYSNTPGTTIFVVSTEPAMSFNDRYPKEEKQWWKEVVMVGQVPVKVCGDAPVNAFLIPSGDGDGCARAVQRDWLDSCPELKEQVSSSPRLSTPLGHPNPVSTASHLIPKQCLAHDATA